MNCKMAPLEDQFAAKTEPLKKQSTDTSAKPTLEKCEWTNVATLRNYEIVFTS